MSTSGLILIVVAMAGLGALLVGILLLVWYFRYNREGDWYEEPEAPGGVVRCSNCGYMNPANAPACLNCRQPLAYAPGYQPPAPPPSVGRAPTIQPNVISVGPTAPAPQVTAPAAIAAAMKAPPPPVPERANAAAMPPNMPRAWLEGVGGAMMGQRARLIQSDTLVGRSSVCDVQVPDPKVSRRHFMIRYGEGNFFLQDQGSARGTRVNGQRTMAQRLTNGDHIEFGDAGVVFRCDEV